MKQRIKFIQAVFLIAFIQLLLPPNLFAKTTPMHIPCQFQTGFLWQDFEEFRIEKDKALWSVGMKKKRIKEITIQGAEASYPLALSNSEQRTANHRNLKCLRIYMVAKYKTEGKDYCLVEIPAAENVHMPAEFKLIKTIYCILRLGAINDKKFYDANFDGAPEEYYTPSGFYPGKKIPCRIIAAEEINPDFNIKNNKEWKKYFDPWEYELVQEGLNKENWPEAISTPDGLLGSGEILKYYSAEAVSKFSEGRNIYYIIHLESTRNDDMPLGYTLPDDVDDIYMVIGEKGLDLSRGYDEDLDGSRLDIVTEENTKEPEIPAATISLAAGEKKACRITDRGELVSHFDWKKQKEVLAKYLDEKTIQYVINHSTEEAWPVGLSTLENRNSHDLDFKYFITYVVAICEAENTYLVWVPAAENKHLPADLRPNTDIYFSYSFTGLSFDRKYDPLLDGKPNK